MRPRALLAGLGGVMLAVGILEMTRPGLLPIRGDAVLVTIVGLLPLVLAYRAVRRRRAQPVRLAEPADVEVPVPVPSPGADLDDVLESFAAPRRYARGVRIRGLTEAAVAVLTAYRGLDEPAAREAVAAGEWTDDPVAAAFLARGRTPPIDARLRAVVGPGSLYWRSIRRTVEAVCAIADVAAPATADRWTLRSAIGLTAARTREYVPYPEVDASAVTRSTTPTNRWLGIGGLALAAVGVGTVARSPAIALAGAAGVGYAAFAHAGRVPDVDLEVDRTVEDERPADGDHVGVSLTVRNGGDAPLPDLRIVDGVPPALGVASGAPRRGCSLGPGQAVTVEYTVEARRGEHRFAPVTIIAGDRAGTVEHELTIPDPATLTCIPPLRAVTGPVPLRRRATGHAGRVGIDRGGEGVEFHGVRSYRPGDPVTRIDWRRLARTGTPATLEYREEHAARVVLVVDARRAAYTAPDPGERHAVDRSVAAAARIAARLLDDGDRVGFAAIPTPGSWLSPGSGPDHRTELRRRLATDRGVSPLAPDGVTPSRRAVDQLVRRLAPGDQLVVFTPLTDHIGARNAARLDAHRPVTVVSPDPTGDGTATERLARVGRAVRLRELRGAGIPVVDWPGGTALEVALARAADHGRTQ